ncbi:hypothetical protein [Bradyrhizobium sp. Bra64]|uniref:hypothetical protein n=1 Tax=Bradyrhizobium sp. Bra64 TaxID=2926009 RepID=UPI0021182E4E|nr:hypothetical protein [Bradyrhizobium sp. Bra64]
MPKIAKISLDLLYDEGDADLIVARVRRLASLHRAIPIGTIDGTIKDLATAMQFVLEWAAAQSVSRDMFRVVGSECLTLDKDADRRAATPAQV